MSNSYWVSVSTWTAGGSGGGVAGEAARNWWVARSTPSPAGHMSPRIRSSRQVIPFWTLIFISSSARPSALCVARRLSFSRHRWLFRNTPYRASSSISGLGDELLIGRFLTLYRLDYELPADTGQVESLKGGQSLGVDWLTLLDALDQSCQSIWGPDHCL